MSWTTNILPVINSQTDADHYDGSSTTLTAGRYYLALLLNMKGTAADAPISIGPIGGAQPFSAVAGAVQTTPIATGLKRGAVWELQCTSTTTAALRVDFGTGVTQLGCRCVFVEIVEPVATVAIVNVKITRVDSNTTISLTPDALLSALNLLIAMEWQELNDNSETPSGTGWAALGAGASGASPNSTLEAAKNDGGSAQTLTYTGTSANRGMIIVEVAAPSITGTSSLAVPLAGSATGTVTGGGISIPVAMHHYRQQGQA